MATLPFSGLPDVQQQGPVDAFEHTQATPQEFGAGVGQAEERLGQTGEQTGNVLAENAVRLETLAQVRNASNATSAYSNALGQEYAKYGAMEGQAAHDYYPTFQKNIGDLRDQLGSTLQSPFAKQQFDEQSRFMMNQYNRSGAVHAADGLKQSFSNAADGEITTKSAFMVNMQNNPAAVVAAANGVADAARRKATLYGQDPDAAALVASGRSYHQLFESMIANGNTSGAQGLYQHVRPFMDAGSIAEVDRIMKPATDRATGDAAAQGVYGSVVPAGAGSRGLRNNNPLNLEYRDGQGAAASDGRFGIYPSVEDGIAAATKQLRTYQDRDGLNTVSQIVGKWAPPGENNTPAYAASVARSMGVDPNAPLDLHDGTTAAKLVSAMATVENGRSVDPAAVQRGVLLASGVNVARTASLPTSGDARAPLTGDQILEATTRVEDDPTLSPEAKQWAHARLEQRLSAYNQALRADAENAVNGIVSKALQNPYSVSLTDIATNGALTGPEKASLSHELVAWQSGKAQGDGDQFGDVVGRIQAPVGDDSRINSTRDLVPMLGHGLTYSGLQKAQNFIKDRDAPDGPTLKAAMDTWKAQILGGAWGDPKQATPATRQRWVDFLAAVQPTIDQAKGKMPMAEIVGASGPIQKMIETGHYVLSGEEMWQSSIPSGTGAPGGTTLAAPVVGHWYMPVGNFTGQFREVPAGTPGARRLTAPSFRPQNFENPAQAEPPTAPINEQ